MHCSEWVPSEREPDKNITIIHSPSIKGTVHPKKIIVIIYSPSSISKPVWLCLFCWTQMKIFWRMRETEQYLFSFYGSQWCPKTAWLQTFIEISSFVFRTNTFIQVWKHLRRSKWWQKFRFWVYCPFNIWRRQKLKLNQH